MRGFPAWLGKTLAVAAAYCITGKLGVLLAIPPGYATTVWLPSGIAFGGVLLGGYGVWPGIVLGSFCVNLGTSFDVSTAAAIVKTLAVPLSIGTGAALQALFGAWLVRRFAAYPGSLERDADVLKFLLLGGPLSCLVNATWGPVTLLAAGIIPPTAFLFSWGTWWVGDAIGVMVTAPLVLLATSGGLLARRGKVLVGISVSVLFALVVVLFAQARTAENRRLREEFGREAREVFESLNRQVRADIEILRSLQGFFHAVGDVNRGTFQTFAGALLVRHPGIQALEWHPRVPLAERAAWEEAARRDGLDGFQFTEHSPDGKMVRAGERAEYVPVYYAAPLQGNERALGFDLTSDPVRREALDRAWGTGEPAATAPITLVQETGSQTGFLIVLSLHPGYVSGVFRAGDLAETALKGLNLSGMALRLRDETGDTLLWDSGSQDLIGKSDYAWSIVLDMAGRRWRLTCAPTLEYLIGRQSWAAWSVLTGGLLFTALLGCLLLVMTARTARVERLVAARTAELDLEKQRLREKSAELERSNRELDHFASIASHDLQEPVRKMASFSELLVEKYRGRLDPDADEILGYITDGAQRMRALIRGLLEYSQVGKGKLQAVSTDMNAVLDQVLADLAVALQESGAVVTRDPLPTVRADPGQMGQLLLNLVGNAIKYRRPGEAPKVHVSAARKDGEAVFSVSDNGIGIDPKHFERIFGLFQRLHGRSEYPGTGIGLSLCKRIVEHHGGRIWVSSEPGQGATFYFTLPPHP